MSNNRNLNRAKRAKQNEFYTPLSAIESELSNYKEHFANKVVLCNCNDAVYGGFKEYFLSNFDSLGLKKLICTAYEGSNGNGVAYIYNDRYGMNEEVYELNGPGDFRSAEMILLLKMSDIVVTNPPFSLFREFISQLLSYGKKFLIIGNMNAITYNEVFPHIMNNTLWLGTQYVKCFSKNGDTNTRFGNILWYTNLDNKNRHSNIPLTCRYNPKVYLKYDNCDAIEVSQTKFIPMDYDGVMGVPISFLGKYNPNQFRIVGRINNPRITGMPPIYKRLLIQKV